MRLLFKEKSFETLYLTDAKKLKKLPFGIDVLKSYKKTIKIILNVDSLKELKKFKGLSFEPMKKERKGDGRFAVRLNDQYRLHLSLESNDDVIVWIEEISKHYEKISI
jgi:plasmid maintenance system killer protein